MKLQAENCVALFIDAFPEEICVREGYLSPVELSRAKIKL